MRRFLTTAMLALVVGCGGDIDNESQGDIPDFENLSPIEACIAARSCGEDRCGHEAEVYQTCLTLADLENPDCHHPGDPPELYPSAATESANACYLDRCEADDTFDESDSEPGGKVFRVGYVWYACVLGHVVFARTPVDCDVAMNICVNGSDWD